MTEYEKELLKALEECSKRLELCMKRSETVTMGDFGKHNQIALENAKAVIKKGQG